jgi:hypothetical protein
MAAKLGEVGGIPVVKKDERGYILENGVIIEDTFAEMFPVVVTSPAKLPLFSKG